MNNISRSDYEELQVKLIEAWEQQDPSVVAKGVGILAKPAVWLAERVIPQSAIKAALNSANSAGKKLADESDILRDANVRTIEDIRKLSLEKSDQLANEVHNWAIGIATAEGGTAGVTGVAGIALDIPAVLTLALRTIHKIGLCYGYRADTKEEQDFVLSVLSAAGSNSQQEKTQALVALRTIEVLVQKQTWKEIEKRAGQTVGKEAAVIAIKNLCKQLGINLTKRKALQIIPAVGAVVGAAVNADFLRDVGYAARRVYQKRWLEDNGKWIESTDQETGDAEIVKEINSEIVKDEFQDNYEEETIDIENEKPISVPVPIEEPVSTKTPDNTTGSVKDDEENINKRSLKKPLKRSGSFMKSFLKGAAKITSMAVTATLDGVAKNVAANADKYREKLESQREKMGEEKFEESMEQLENSFAWAEERLEQIEERNNEEQDQQ